MVRVGIGKMLALAAFVAVAGVASQANADPITFASFQQVTTSATPWTFTNNTGSPLTSTFTASGVMVNFQSSTTPGSQVLNFNGVAIASLTATVSGTAVTGGGLVSQGLAAGAELKFVNAANTSDVVLDVIFTGAITGTVGGTGSGGASTSVVGQAIAYSSNHQVGTFQTPFAFSITLTGPLSVNMADNILSSFSSSSTGSFISDSSGAAPAPLPAAAWGGLSMMSALCGVGAFIRRRRR